jgi:hypothetical protein
MSNQLAGTIVVSLMAGAIGGVLGPRFLTDQTAGNPKSIPPPSAESVVSFIGEGPCDSLASCVVMTTEIAKRVSDQHAQLRMDYSQIASSLRVELDSRRKSIVAILGECDSLGEGWRPVRRAKGRFLLSRDSDTSKYSRVGDVGGEERVTLAENEMPRHRHLEPPPNGNGLDGYVGGNQSENKYELGERHKGASPAYADPPWAGGGAAHNNMPPYLIVQFCEFSASGKP